MPSIRAGNLGGELLQPLAGGLEVGRGGVDLGVDARGGLRQGRRLGRDREHVGDRGSRLQGPGQAHHRHACGARLLGQQAAGAGDEATRAEGLGGGEAGDRLLGVAGVAAAENRPLRRRPGRQPIAANGLKRAGDAFGRAPRRRGRRRSPSRPCRRRRRRRPARRAAAPTRSARGRRAGGLASPGCRRASRRYPLTLAHDRALQTGSRLDRDLRREDRVDHDRARPQLAVAQEDRAPDLRSRSDPAARRRRLREDRSRPPGRSRPMRRRRSPCRGAARSRSGPCPRGCPRSPRGSAPASRCRASSRASSARAAHRRSAAGRRRARSRRCAPGSICLEHGALQHVGACVDLAARRPASSGFSRELGHLAAGGGADQPVGGCVPDRHQAQRRPRPAGLVRSQERREVEVGEDIPVQRQEALLEQIGGEADRPGGAQRARARPDSAAAARREAPRPGSRAARRGGSRRRGSPRRRRGAPSQSIM